MGTSLPNFAYAAGTPRVINPTIADTYNPNVIPPPPSSPDRAIIAWDTTGGGNAVSSAETFATAQSKFDLYAYFDTRDLPQMSNASGVQFRGSEISIYGIGSKESSRGNKHEPSRPSRVIGILGLGWLYAYREGLLEWK